MTSATITADRADRSRFQARVQAYRRQHPEMPLAVAMENVSAEVANEWLKAGFSKEQVAKAIGEFNPIVAAEVLSLGPRSFVRTERFSTQGTRL